jgi:hypothetical protein
VTELSTYDLDNVQTVIDPANYFVSVESPDFPVRISSNASTGGWANALNNRIVNVLSIEWTAGYGTAAQIPPAITQGILMIINALYNNRGDCDSGAECGGCSLGAKVLSPYRVLKV